ncbi:MAG TPA: hypothetical protein VHO90_20410, partial [Bacteroidales bacterium]|nr:hypothetical protein [Bacteroidales bacterium]
DSAYSVDVKDLFHTRSSSDSISDEFVYYPVMLASEFVDQLSINKIKPDNRQPQEPSANQPVFLWGILHNSLGGGWIHFLNCMLYSLEKQYLDLTAPLMTRPQTDWKPNPVTKTYLRTKNWKYYIPYEQKYAIKEYKLKKKEKQLNDIQHIPKEWVDLFLHTSQKKYDKLKAEGDYKTISKIDLVKVMLGSNYLGKAQLSYIQTMVQKSILQYSFSRLPSLIVFDDIEVAVAMELDEKGYRIEKIVFRNVDDLTPQDKYNKEMQVRNTIRSINILNQKLFEQKLRRYYQ